MKSGFGESQHILKHPATMLSFKRLGFCFLIFGVSDLVLGADLPGDPFIRVPDTSIPDTLLTPLIIKPLGSSNVEARDEPGILRGLLESRQSCSAGYGVCSTGGCCPLGGRCCSNGIVIHTFLGTLADLNLLRWLLQSRLLVLLYWYWADSSLAESGCNICLYLGCCSVTETGCENVSCCPTGARCCRGRCHSFRLEYL